MAFLNRPQIKEFVKIALKEVADFTGDIENYEFKYFNEFHKTVFLNKLKEIVNKEPYYDRNGNADYERYYDIALSMDSFSNWYIMADCIQFVLDYQVVKKRNPNKLNFA